MTARPTRTFEISNVPPQLLILAMQPGVFAPRLGKTASIICAVFKQLLAQMHYFVVVDSKKRVEPRYFFFQIVGHARFE